MGTYAKFFSLAKSVKFLRSGKPVGSAVTAWGLAVNRLSGGEKIILYEVCFAYSLLSFLLVVVLLVFPLLSY